MVHRADDVLQIAPTPEFHDWRIAISKLAAYAENLPSREVWFYIGHCSDDDGNNSEFSFAPMKVTRSQAEVLSRPDLDSSGTHVSSQAEWNAVNEMTALAKRLEAVQVKGALERYTCDASERSSMGN